MSTMQEESTVITHESDRQLVVENLPDGSDIPQDEETALQQEEPQQEEAQEEEQEQELTLEEKKQIRNNRIKKGLVALLLIGFVVFVIVDSTTNGYIRDGIESFLEWIEDNPIGGFFVFMVVYFFATILFVPGLILTLGAGFVFGMAFGLGGGIVIATLAVFVGASTGSIVAFLLGRYLLRDWVTRLTEKYAIFEALDVAFQENGFRIMVLLRLSPIIPFNVVNYIAGVTAISFRQFCLALVAILPGTVLYVFLGASAGSLTGSEDMGSDPTVTIIIIVVGVVFGVFAILVTSIYARRELKRVVAAREAEKEDEEDDSADIEAPTTDESDEPQVLEENETTTSFTRRDANFVSVDLDQEESGTPPEIIPEA